MCMVKWLNDNQGFVMAMLTLVYVLTTGGIVVLMLRANKISQQNLDTAIQLDRNRSRPYVLFNITSSTSHHIYATVKNLGLTAAYNVHVSINPKLEYISQGQEKRESALTSQKISFLPPNEEVTDLIDTTEAFYQSYSAPIFEGSITYEDSTALKYKEHFRINLTYRMKRSFVREREVIDELRDLNQILAELSKYLTERGGK